MKLNTQIRQMWENGPTRSWSPTADAEHRVPCCGGFAGSYVCQQCFECVIGVYCFAGKWICEGCLLRVKGTHSASADAGWLYVGEDARSA